MKVSKKEFKWHISCNGLFRNIFNLALSRIYASRVGCKFAYCNHSVSPSSMSIINIGDIWRVVAWLQELTLHGQ